MLKKLRNLIRDEKGQDLIEYGLLASFLSIAALVTIRLIGPLIVPLYDAIQAALS
jgi:Flp pilus assembly pilin Flp